MNDASHTLPEDEQLQASPEDERPQTTLESEPSQASSEGGLPQTSPGDPRPKVSPQAKPSQEPESAGEKPLSDETERSADFPVPADDALPVDSPESATADTSNGSMERFFPPTWALLVLLLGIVMVAAVAVGVLRQTWFAAQPGGDAEPLSVDKLATFDSPPDLPTEQQILQGNGTPLSTALPTSMQIQDVQYPVVPVPLESGRWPVPAEDKEVAVWVYGTVINYVIGLPYTTTTESRLAGLAPGSKITLTLGSGNALVFGSPQARRYAATDTSPLSQAQPGLTLVLLGPPEDGVERLVIRARYLPDASPTEAGAQRIEGLELQVLESAVTGEAEDGQDFVVEYQVTQQRDALVETNLFDFVLEDGEGQRYAINPAISQQGQYGPLPPQINAGETVQASAGFRIPRDVQPPLTWIFRADATSGEAARFSLDYEPPLPGPPQPQVELTEAFADQDRDAIVISGVVRNLGESRLDVLQEQVNLSSSAGDAELIVSTPPLPWQVEAGAEQMVELQFVRPAGVDSVLLDIVGFTFQIDGLP